MRELIEAVEDRYEVLEVEESPLRIRIEFASPAEAGTAFWSMAHPRVRQGEILDAALRGSFLTLYPHAPEEIPR